MFVSSNECIGGKVLDTVWPIFEVENFCRFHGSEHGRKKFLPQNFKFIAAAMCGWKLDHENFILTKFTS